MQPVDHAPQGASCCGFPATGRGAQAVPAAAVPAAPDARGAVPVPGGRVRVGAAAPVIPDDGEGPPRFVGLKPFQIGRCAVSNAEFEAFVAATGYVTEAERIGWSAVFVPPDRPPALPPLGAIGASAPSWWRNVEGACWRAPEGPGSDLAGRERHPVVQVSLADARAYADWRGGRLPTEAEWEHAARGGLAAPTYPWGDRDPDDEDFLPCNIWQGAFPHRDEGRDGFAGTAPADAFAPNGYGLFNMCGNVWEWTSDRFLVRSLGRAAQARNARSRSAGEHVLKGGSFLCHRSYCFRYRIAARTAAPPDSAAVHLGFRLAFDGG